MIHRHCGAVALLLASLCASIGVSADTYPLPLLPSASDSLREGVVRIVNHSADAGEVAITAIDDAGYVYGPITVTVEGQHAVHLSSTDLELGNAIKGLSGALGAGQGDWRLVLETSLDIEPSTFVETTAGFVDRVHDLLPPTWFYHRVALPGTDESGQHEGQLRLINPAETEAQVIIFGLNEAGETLPGQVSLVMPAGTARTVTARELEGGATGLAGQLGEDEGDWQLLVFADPSVEVMTLLDSVSGPLANLSAAVTEPGDMVFFPSSAHASRNGLLRITNRAGAGDIRIHAVDDAGTDFGPVTLKLAGDGTTELSSEDLENGNAEKGLTTGLGSGEGDWRLTLESDLELNVVAYARTQDGFVTAIDDVVAEGYLRHHVPWFNPASETMQSSQLRLINPTDSAAEVLIRAWDDEGEPAPDGAVSLALAAGASRTVSAGDLEDGAEGFTGNLGDGEGYWRLSVQADRAIRVMSLVESSEGHLTNISTPSSLPRFLNSCIGGPADADGDGISDHCDRDSAAALRELAKCADGTYVEDPDGNSGLVRDCRVLIGFANLQAQSENLPDDHVLRRWGHDEQALMGTWEGITVADGHVTEIRMAGKDGEPALTGFIPPELGQLTELTVLDLSHNEFTGPIPASLGGLENLGELSLHGNLLTGAIPPELGELSNLSTLRLDYNRLSGDIPPELGELVNLFYLDLSNNALSGPIPGELGQLAGVTDVRLHDNRLSGRIPAELGQLVQLRILMLYENSLTGRIPPELGQLANLNYLSLQRNRLRGSIPAELGNLAVLIGLDVHENRLTGTIPWALWERVTRGELSISLGGTLIHGFGAPPLRTGRPTFSSSPAENGNASHHSVAYYQGPLTWSWNWQDEAVEHQQPILGRWAVLAVQIDHEVAEPPLVITRVLDGDDEVLIERLPEAGLPSTRSTGSGQWRTEYVFELPGEHFQAGNQIEHVIDPDNELAETDEDDNVGATILLYGAAPPRLRVTFVPFVHASDSEMPFLEAEALMAGSRAYWPIADDFEAAVRSPVSSDASGKFALLNELRAIWNAEADAQEFYHGVFSAPWPGHGAQGSLGGGVADAPGRVAMSEVSSHRVIPHELGHNLSLLHPPGCEAGYIDHDYPYANGGLGPDQGWDVNWRRFISNTDEGYGDVMSYCTGNEFVSDYHYGKASEYWLSTDAGAEVSSVLPFTQAGGVSGPGPASANRPSANANRANVVSDSAGGLALSGRIDASGVWSLTHAQNTEKGPRPPAPNGELTLILFDENGVELYREPLSAIVLSEGGEAGWAARTSRPAQPAREVVILDAQGEEVLRESLPEL